MTCPRCQGLFIMISYRTAEAPETLLVQHHCINCGNVTDDVIEGNRALTVLPMGELTPMGNKRKHGYVRAQHEPLTMHGVKK